jgi:hypothetical protein
MAHLCICRRARRRLSICRLAWRGSQQSKNAPVDQPPDHDWHNTHVHVLEIFYAFDYITCATVSEVSPDIPSRLFDFNDALSRRGIAGACLWTIGLALISGKRSGMFHSVPCFLYLDLTDTVPEHHAGVILGGGRYFNVPNGLH